jgi:hypothetical protein
MVPYILVVRIFYFQIFETPMQMTDFKLIYVSIKKLDDDDDHVQVTPQLKMYSKLLYTTFRPAHSCKAHGDFY